jgi:hypothetical protein
MIRLAANGKINPSHLRGVDRMGAPVNTKDHACYPAIILLLIHIPPSSEIPCSRLAQFVLIRRSYLGCSGNHDDRIAEFHIQSLSFNDYTGNFIQRMQRYLF